MMLYIAEVLKQKPDKNCSEKTESRYVDFHLNYMVFPVPGLHGPVQC